MKRKIVTIYVTPTGFCQAEAKKVEAHCGRCEYFQEDFPNPIDGKCFRYPVRSVVGMEDWCGEFKPDWDLCE